MSRGKSETDRLRSNLEDQLERLMTQLADLEESQEELGEEDYTAMKADTLEQMQEFSVALSKMKSGELSLVDHINQMQLAIQASVSNAFRTPDIIRFFAKKQPGELRTRLAEIERDAKIGKLSASAASDLRVEILTALARLGEALSPEERAQLGAGVQASTREFARAHEGVDTKVAAALGANIGHAQGN